MLSTVISTSLLIIVFILIIVRPKNIGVAWPASIGALLAIIFGLIPLSGIKTVFFDTWNASLTLIALFILAEALNANNFFDWAAIHLAQKSTGSGWKLYIYTLLLTTFVTAFLANDGAILILTPIFATLLQKIYPHNKKEWLPYLFATGFFADSMSALFLPSNLTNILIADAFHLTFIDIFTKMAIPTAIAFVVGAFAFGIRYKSRLQTSYSLNAVNNLNGIIKDWTIFWSGIVVLALLILGYIIGGQLQIPTSVVALPLALFMLFFAHFKKLTSVYEVIKITPWSLLIYALAMFILVTAAYDTHSLHIITQPLRDSASSNNNLLKTGAITAILSALVNNLPATLISILALKNLHSIASFTLYAVLLGVNIGPKFTPFGSLSTLLWLGLMGKKGIKISWREYFKENWWITILVLSASLISLYVTSLF